MIDPNKKRKLAACYLIKSSIKTENETNMWMKTLSNWILPQYLALTQCPLQSTEARKTLNSCIPNTSDGKIKLFPSIPHLKQSAYPFSINPAASLC